MIQRKVTGWVLVANGSECRIYARNSLTGKLDIVREFSSEESRLQTREIGEDKPGRAFDSVGGMRHAMEPREDFHKQARRIFAREIAEFLNAASLQDHFHALSIASSATFLGELRMLMDSHVQEKIVMELNKDLTHVPTHDLLSHLYKKAG